MSTPEASGFALSGLLHIAGRDVSLAQPALVVLAATPSTPFPHLVAPATGLHTHHALSDPEG